MTKSKKQKTKKVNAKPKKVKELEETVKVEEPEGSEDIEMMEGGKKGKKGWIALAIVVVLLIGGGFVAKKFLTKTTVQEETVEFADGVRGISNYFKEYLLDRVKAEELFRDSYKNLKEEKILEALSELKDGFSKVSRGVTGNYKSGEYKEIAEVMSSDASVYLTAVRELRSIMTDGNSGEDKKRLAFAEKADELAKDLRSAIYVSRAAFHGEVSGFSSKSALIFDGPVLAEVGGGVMNIVFGDFDEKVVAVSSEKMDAVIKTIDAVKLYGYVSTRLINIGTSLRDEMESGWVKHVKADIGRMEVKLTRTRVSTVMKNVDGMNDELKAQGISGLIGEEGQSEENELSEVVKGLTGKR
ncbi:hypothetical protein IKG06_02045 [Candidatus Saccharibacteria bacterium]|nr:hypothetical protein [Candidatus Saccharibacteria bacterium]